MGTKRCFLAVPLPASVKVQLKEMQDKLRLTLDRCDLRVNWVKTENMYITSNLD